MTDINPQALEHACQCAGRSVHHFDRMALDLPLRASIVAHARAIEQHEQFKREVSDAVDTITQCYHRLEELGWNNPQYCPKDGSALDLIESGSSGIHRGFYLGEWPRGSWQIPDEHGDLWGSYPILARAALDQGDVG